MRVAVCHVKLPKWCLTMTLYVKRSKTLVFRFEVVPVNKENKREAYAQIDELMQGNDLLVLARYMQILDEEFVQKWEMKIINIHHSFLPAFVGANPYKEAYEKGVKLIGATAHYVTADLDQGPIIEQDVERVSHDFTVEQLREIRSGC